MAELAYTDLPAAVLARFDDADDYAAAQAAIDTALVAARRYCGWSVSPVVTDDEVTVDGSGGQVLSVPTLNLVSVSTVDEDGVTITSSDLRASRLGLLRKRSGGWWTSAYDAVTVTMTHGFAEDDALDWRRAVINLVDDWSEASLRDGSDMKRKKVDDVEYEWFETALSTDAELAEKFSQFRILPSP
jgi:hypothetical protein